MTDRGRLVPDRHCPCGQKMKYTLSSHSQALHLKGELDPDIKLVSIEAEKGEKQVSESLSKKRLKIRKL